jgi:RNA polymerase sigma-70 factor (ECF subfamily)
MTGNSADAMAASAGARHAAELDLIAAAQAGDASAFRGIVERHHRLVAGLAYRLSGDADLADDVAQETFVRAWRGLARFEPRRPGSLRSWLCRIAHNLTMDALRRRRSEPLTSERPDHGLSPFEAASRSETGAAVRQAVLQLPDHLRAAIVLREYEEMSYAEIAAVLEIPIGTVMSRLHSARKRLADDLAPLFNSGEDL